MSFYDLNFANACLKNAQREATYTEMAKFDVYLIWRKGPKFAKLDFVKISLDPLG